jgi:hypothetical protein
MDKNVIKIIDMFLVVGTLCFVLLFLGYATPRVIAPIDKYNTTNDKVLFEFSKGEKLMIDSDEDFVNAREIPAREDIVVSLKPGIYYWKVVGLTGESGVRKLVVNSEAELTLKEMNGRYVLFNIGNVELRIEAYSLERMSESELKIGESNGVEGEKFVGGQNE